MPVTSIKTLDEWQHMITQNSVVVVDFYAAWCGPCRIIGPKFEDMSKEESMAGKVAFAKVDVENEALQPVVQHYEISAMPTLMVFKDGQKSHKTVGANLDQVRQAIEQVL